MQYNLSSHIQSYAAKLKLKRQLKKARILERRALRAGGDGAAQDMSTGYTGANATAPSNVAPRVFEHEQVTSIADSSTAPPVMEATLAHESAETADGSLHSEPAPAVAPTSTDVGATVAPDSLFDQLKWVPVEVGEAVEPGDDSTDLVFDEGDDTTLTEEQEQFIAQQEQFEFLQLSLEEVWCVLHC